MALEEICGFNKLPFMRTDISDEFVKMTMKMANNAHNLIADNPVKSLNQILQEKRILLNLTYGATTLGFKYRGGIFMCASSQSTTNDLYATQNGKKIMELDNCMLGTIAERAGDYVHWQRVLASECRLYRLTNGNKNMPISTASKIIQNIVNRFQGMGLTMGLILAGYDPYPDGPKLMYINDEGDHIEGNLFSIGSGSFNALQVLNSAYNWYMSDEQAFNLALRALYSAANYDPHFAGYISLYHMTETGWKIVSTDNRQTFYNIQTDLVEPMDCD